MHVNIARRGRRHVEPYRCHRRCELVRMLARSSGQLSKEETLQTQKVVECGKDVLCQRFRSTVAGICNAPAMMSKSADCAPVKAVQRVSTALPSRQSVQRSGKKGVEILVKRKACVLWRVPVLLCRQCQDPLMISALAL